MPRFSRIAIAIPTPDPSREPARTAIARARETTRGFGDAVSIHPVVSSGPEFRFSRSVNRGIAEAPDADAWVLLNDDCFMDDGWLEALLDAVRRHPGVGLVGAVLRFPDGSLQHAGGYLLSPMRFFVHHAVRNRAPFYAIRCIRRARRGGAAYVAHYHGVSRRHRLDLVTAACVLVTRACHDALGGFDERYEFTFEDVDYCLRALEAGFELALALQARGTHLERASGGGLRQAAGRSEALFHREWPPARILAATRKGGRRGIHHRGRGTLLPP